VVGVMGSEALQSWQRHAGCSRVGSLEMGHISNDRKQPKEIVNFRSPFIIERQNGGPTLVVISG